MYDKLDINTHLTLAPLNTKIHSTWASNYASTIEYQHTFYLQNPTQTTKQTQAKKEKENLPWIYSYHDWHYDQEHQHHV